MGSPKLTELNDRPAHCYRQKQWAAADEKYKGMKEKDKEKFEAKLKDKKDTYWSHVEVIKELLEKKTPEFHRMHADLVLIFLRHQENYLSKAKAAITACLEICEPGNITSVKY